MDTCACGKPAAKSIWAFGMCHRCWEEADEAVARTEQRALEREQCDFADDEWEDIPF